MKYFIVLACTLAAATASHLVAPLEVHGHYHGAQHLPVIGPNGVPVDTPEVQHARAAHLQHKVEAHARNGDLAVVSHAPLVHHDHHADHHVHYDHVGHVDHHVGHLDHHVAHADHHQHVAPAVHAYAAGYNGVHVAHQPAAYPTTAVLPTIANGVPLETPEVVAAKSKHFAAHAEALARTGHGYGYGYGHGHEWPVHHLKRRQVYAFPAYAGYSAYGAYPYSAHYGTPFVY